MPNLSTGNTANIKAVITAQDKASETLSRFGNNVSNVSDKIRTSLKITALAASAAIGTLIVKNIDNAVKRVDTLANFPKVLIAMGSTSQDAKNATNKLSRSLQGLPTTLDEGASGIQSLVAAGLTVPKATDAFLAMNDALLASGQNSQDTQIVMQSLTRAISAGSVDASTMQAALSRMPTVMQALSKETGKSAGELFKLYSNNPKKLIDDMIRLDKSGSGSMKSLRKQAKDATGGIGTAFQNMNTAVARGLASLITSIGQKNISDVINNFGKVFEKALKSIPEILGKLSELWKAVYNLLMPSLSALWDTISKQLIPALVNFWKKVIQPMLPVIGALLVGAIWLVTNAFNVLFKIIVPVINFLSDNTWVIYALITAFVILKGAMLLDKTFKALQTGFDLLTNKTIPSAMLKITALRSLTASKLTMGGIVIAGALADIALVKKAVDTVRGAINEMNNAKKSANSLATGNKQIYNQMQALLISGNSKQRDAAQKWINAYKRGYYSGYATGGYTGHGGTNEPAGIVHKGEYVIPKSQVNQQTGMPNMGSNVTIHLNVNVGVYSGTEIEKRKLAQEIFKSLKDVATSKGTTVGKMMGAS